MATTSDNGKSAGLSVIHLRVLGRCAVSVGARRVDPNAEIVFAALLALGLKRSRPWTRAEFGALLWPDVEGPQRNSRLRWLLSKLRSLGVRVPANSIELEVENRVELDLDEIGASDSANETLGEILAGYAPSFSAPFAEWIDRRRDALTAQLTRRFTSERRAARERGDSRASARWTERLARVAPGGTGENSRVAVAPSESLFVGRTEQLRRIKGLLEGAAIGHGGALLLVGPAGIGKTRLLRESERTARELGMHVIDVRCQRGGLAPLSGLVELVQGLLNAPGAAGCDPVHSANLHALVEKRRDTDSDGAAEISLPMLSVSRRAHLVEGIADLLGALSSESPFVVHLDDAHWSDPALGWMWREVLARSASLPVAWLFAARPTTEPILADVPRVVVGALEPNDAAALLNEMFGDSERSTDERAHQFVLDRGAGSPLFIRELARHTIARGIDDSLPPSLAGLFEASLSKLSEPALLVLQVAAVLGVHATTGRMERITELSRSVFLSAFGELEAAGILTADSTGEVVGHVLWAEAALLLTPVSRSRALHRHAAEVFDEEMVTAPSTALLWECAYHWERAGDLGRARSTTLAGAAHLLQSGFPEDAIAGYEKALTQTTEPAESVDILGRLIEALNAAGNEKRAVAAIELHQRLGAQHVASFNFHSDAELTGYLIRLRSMVDLRSTAERLFDCVTDERATTHHRLAAARLAAAAFSLHAPDLLQRLRDLVIELEPTSSQDYIDWGRVQVRYELLLGDVNEALRIDRDLIARTRAEGDRWRLLNLLTLVGTTFITAGRLGDAFALIHEGLGLAKRIGGLSYACQLYDCLIGTSLDTDPPVVVEKYLKQYEELGKRLDAFGGSPMLAVSLKAHRAQLSVITGETIAVEAAIGSVDFAMALSAPKWRSRFLAIHLQERLNRGDLSDAQPIATALEEALSFPIYWADWPASVLATYLRNVESEDAARRFATRFVREFRRELYPPPEPIRSLCADSTH